MSWFLLRFYCSQALSLWVGIGNICLCVCITYTARLLCPWNVPGNNTGVGCHFLLQGIFPAQGLNPVSCIAGGFFTDWTTREPLHMHTSSFISIYIFIYLSIYLYINWELWVNTKPLISVQHHRFYCFSFDIYYFIFWHWETRLILSTCTSLFVQSSISDHFQIYAIIFTFDMPRILSTLMVCVCVLVAQLCLTLGKPMDCSPPGSSVHGMLQARIMEWVAISFSRGSSWSRDRTLVSCIAGRFFTTWTTREAQSNMVLFDNVSYIKNN